MQEAILTCEEGIEDAAVIFLYETLSFDSGLLEPPRHFTGLGSGPGKRRKRGLRVADDERVLGACSRDLPSIAFGGKLADKLGAHDKRLLVQ